MSETFKPTGAATRTDKDRIYDLRKRVSRLEALIHSKYPRDFPAENVENYDACAAGETQPSK
jgi:hypothetical protein